MKRKAWHILGFLTAAWLWGCSGAGGPAAGAGGALDSGGGSPVGGSGNFAAGPVSLPAPSVVAPDAPVTWTNISCTNVPGPNFQCQGTSQSVLANTEIQFRIFPPAAAVPRDTFTAIADAQGAWSVTRLGEAGESVEICPKEKGICGDFRLFKLPPEGGVVDGNSGTMKNLVIDPEGNGWHSRLSPKHHSLGSWIAGLFVSEARAQDAPALKPFTPIYCGSLEGFAVLDAIDATAPTCSLYKAERGAAVSQRVLSFDNCQQDDIHSIVSTKHPVTGQPLLLVAVKNSIHMVETKPTPRIAWEYRFPGEVVSILDQGDRIIAVVNAPTGVAQNLFYVDLRQKAPMGTGCYTPLEWLKGLENVTSSDSLNEAFTMVVYKQPGVYQVMLGRNVPGSTDFRNQPFPLLAASATPLEAKILKVEQNWVWVAVLNAAEKKIRIVKHFMPDTDVLVLGAAPDPIQEISLEALTVGSGSLNVSHPQLFNVNRRTLEMVFVDVSEQGSKLVSIPYAYASGELAPVSVATVTDLGGASPASLRRDDTTGDSGWAYNDGTWQIRRVRTLREATQIQIPSLGMTEEVRTQLLAPQRVVVPSTADEDEDKE